MRLITNFEQNVSSSTKNKENQHWEVALPRFLQSVTSQVMVSPCLRKCQNTRENSRGPWQRTVACLRRLTANLSWLLPSSRSKVSISLTSHKWTSDLLANVTATDDALKSTCLTLCHVERAVLRKQRKHRPLFSHPFIKRQFLVKRMSAVKRIFSRYQPL